MNDNRISFGRFEHPNSELQEFVQGMFDEMCNNLVDDLSRLALGTYEPPHFSHELTQPACESLRPPDEVFLREHEELRSAIARAEDDFRIALDLPHSGVASFTAVVRWAEQQIIGATQVPSELLHPYPGANLAHAAIIYHHSVNSVIGDRACKFNAQSSFLRCAVNPSGPCEGCDHFGNEERDRV